MLNSNIVTSYTEKGVGIECITVCLPHNTASNPPGSNESIIAWTVVLATLDYPF